MYKISPSLRLGIDNSFNTPTQKYKAPLEKVPTNSDTGGHKFPLQSGSTMRHILQNGNLSPLKKTALLRSHEYQSSMNLPRDYEIVSHLSTDGQEFKIAGKRMKSDSSRFLAKNATTGETLCVLKRTPTNNGDFVWMHPENTGLRGGSPSDIRIYNKQSQNWISTSTSQSQHGNTVTIQLFDSSNNRNVGSLCIAPGNDSLRILTIENHMRGQYCSIGSGLLRMAKRISNEKGFGGKISLVCQDEGAAVFFYKSGLRFFGANAQAKNNALEEHVNNSSWSLPNDVICLGDMQGC